MSFELQSQQWPGKRALLLVHGIGNAAKGDYVTLLEKVKAMLGDEFANTAIYQLWYDMVNDWFQSKTQLGSLINAAKEKLTDKIGDPELGPTISESIGDVLWPVLAADARAAAREAYVAQLKQIVQDGVASGVPARRQRLNIICHSLGCFHTYEALHHIAKFPSHSMQPATHEVVFENVIFMASPVQMIRTVADLMGPLVPNKRWLYTVQGDSLSIPSETTLTGDVVKSVRNWVSITGDLDPVGGHFFKVKAPWAYMDVPGQISLIDEQHALIGINSKADLVKSLKASLRAREKPKFEASSPHCWDDYVIRNTNQLHTWCSV